MSNFYKSVLKKLGTSLAVQWLKTPLPNAGGMGLIPGQGTKIPHVLECSQKLKGAKNTTERKKTILRKLKKLRTISQGCFLSNIQYNQFKIYIGLPCIPEGFDRATCQRPLARSLHKWRGSSILTHWEPDWHLHSLRSFDN